MSDIWDYPVNYYALVIEEDAPIRDFLQKYISNPSRSFHVTVIHKDQYGHSEVENWVNENFGKEFDLELTEFCYNERIAGFKVKGDFLCVNSCPHVTASFKRGVSPIETNHMLSSDHLSVPCSLKVRGILLGV